MTHSVTGNFNSLVVDEDIQPKLMSDPVEGRRL